jgi:F5/8 type C domain-containing protein
MDTAPTNIFRNRPSFSQFRNPVVALIVLFALAAIATFATRSFAERGVNGSTPAMLQGAASMKQGKPTLTTDRGSYVPGETITFTGTNWAAGEAVTITIAGEGIKEQNVAQVVADKTGSFVATTIMPESRESIGDAREKSQKAERDRNELEREIEGASGGSFTATAVGSSSKTRATTQFSLAIADRDGERILAHEDFWAHRLSYPTGRFDPAWVRQAAEQDSRIARRIPAGRKQDMKSLQANPLALSPIGFTALGPQPLRMTGCNGCFDYTTTEGRVNAIAVDPTTVTNGSIVAYIATVGGGIWKTTTCCSGSTSWTALTDDALISTTSVDSVVIDPNNHNTIYAGTGDLNYGSFSMGSQGILKSTDGGATWTVLGANIFGAALPEPAGQFPQYQAVGKVRVDPNNSNNVVAGTKTGLYLSYDAGVNWTGPCLTNAFNTMRQDITGLELSNISGTTRIIAAVGTRGFATTVQYNLDQNGANGIYKGTMPASGCPTDFTSIASNANGFVFGTLVTGSPYATGASMNAASGVIYGGLGVGNQLGRIDIAVAPSDPNTMYAQVGSIAANNNAGCGNAAGCQIGVWATTNGGNTWTFMTGSAGGSLRNCAGGNTSGNPGDYPQNWYDQGMAVDPNNPDRVFIDTYDTWLASRTGTSFYNVTCGYNGSAASAHVVHVDHHALAFVPGSSSILLEGSDGGIFASTNANTAVIGTTRNTWVNMDTGINTIEFYSGDISANFATAAAPQANGGAQDNGSMAVTFAGSPTAPVLWQMGRGGDGFTARIDPIGTGTSLRFWQGNNSGSLGRCISGCTAGNATWTTKTGGWTGDTQNFVLPYDLFHGGIPGGDDCPAAGTAGGCGHLIAGTTRVWETITGNASGTGGTVTWIVTNNPTTANLTKGTLGNRSFINQVKYSPKFQSVAIVGTNDGNVQIGFNLGTGVAAAGNWVNVTGGNAVLPNRPVMGIALDPTVAAANLPIGYAAMGGFDQNTPTTPGHVFRVDCTAANCSSFAWADKSGNLPNVPVDCIIVNPNFPQQVFAGTDFGLYYTDDVTVASPIWYRFNTGLPNTMIWDMQIDRGSTTLSLWTRSRGAFVWPLPLGALNPPSVVAAPATGSYNGTAALSATMTSGGQPVPGKSIDFTLNGNSAGSAVTNGSGVATIPAASLAGINANTYPTGVGASFAGDINYAAASGTNSLTVNPANQTITVNTPAPATAQHGSQFVVAATADSGLPVTYGSSGACTNSGQTYTMVSGTGTCTVTYNQPGNSNYNPAPQVMQSVTAQECGSPTNVALGSYGSTAVASSQMANFPAAGVIDGEHNGNNWGSGGGWNDSTLGVFPDNVEVDFNIGQAIGEIDVYTLKDNFNSGSVVTDSTTFSAYGITNFNVQYWTGSVWTDIPGGAVTGNTLVKRKFVFPDVVTDRIRVLVNDSADHAFSRVVEIEAFSCSAMVVPTPTPTPTPTCPSPANVALTTNGSSASASSEKPGFAATGVINGEHNGNDWGTGGGWNDNTLGVFPDNLDVNFNVSQSIKEIDVYTLKDDFNSGTVVTDTTTFTGYGITDFQVQYWNGAAYVNVPGGVVTGNNLVKRKFVFPTITTDKIRVVVNGSADNLYSRVVEVEAFSCTPVVCASPTNVAAATQGSGASASSDSPNFQAAGAINGEHNGNDWGTGGGWNDSTLGVFPDNLDVNFNVNQLINEIDVYTLKDDFNSGSVVTDSTTFTSYGITNFQVQYWNGAAYVNVPGGAVTGNHFVKRKFIFPTISTNKIRVVVNGSADNSFSRVVEVEAFSCNPATPTPTPTPTPVPTPCATDLALPANGGSAVASSVSSASYPASGVINGEHNGNDWGAGGGWNDASAGDFSNDYVQVNLNAIHTLDEIDVYTLKDDFNSGSTVTDTTTFTSYGITSFEVQTSTNGTTFTTVPGGNVTGNNLVKRKFLFASPLSAKHVRVVVHDSADHAFSRVVEIEARSCNPTQLQRVVDDDHAQCPNATFTNITDAINASANGDIIQVCPGTYNEQAVINKSLTLRGAQSGQDARTRSAPLGQEAVITNTCGPVRIVADGVTLDGFIIQGADNTCAGTLGTGVHTNSANSGAQILNNIIQNNTMGVYLQNSGATQAKVQRNLIRGNNNAGAAAGIAIYSDSGLANALIDNNSFFNQSDSAIFLAGTQSNLTISNNDLGGLGVLSANTTTASISGNTSAGTTGFWFDQIRLFGGNSNISITCNSLTGGVRGIRLSSENGSNANVTINNNNIQSHSEAGLRVDTASYSGGAGSLDASSNWWGNASGPTIASNPSGTGDTIIDPDGVVDYTPFLTAVAGCVPTSPPLPNMVMDGNRYKIAAPRN